jgi:hypothetical protein
MYLCVVASRECLPRPRANTVSGFIIMFVLCSTQHCVNEVNASHPDGNIADGIRGKP